MEPVILGGGYTCSVCGQYQRTSALCHHDNNLIKSNMQSQELRIGNYIYYEHTTHIVSGIHGNRVYSWWVKDGEPVIEYEAKDISGTQVENPYMDVISQYEPIPLTDEWLAKLGFKKNITTDLYPTFSYDILNVNDGIVYVLNYGFVNHIKYIHQLQNLYFALTGEELKLK